MSTISTQGFRLLPQQLSPDAQVSLLGEVLSRIESAPLYRPITPGGKPMSVTMTNFGPLGWCTDDRGYRYQATHPVTGQAWPDIPQILLDLWQALADPANPPDACLVNLYDAQAKMGLHQDRDEADFSFPVLSISLGDTAIFRIGGVARSDPTRSVRLASGDVCLLQGPMRLAHHGIDRVLSGSSRLIPGGGRINLTLRRAQPASPSLEAQNLIAP
jgi:DNA oxidative demethylase